MSAALALALAAPATGCCGVLSMGWGKAYPASSYWRIESLPADVARSARVGDDGLLDAATCARACSHVAGDSFVGYCFPVSVELVSRGQLVHCRTEAGHEDVWRPIAEDVLAAAEAERHALDVKRGARRFFFTEEVLQGRAIVARVCGGPYALDFERVPPPPPPRTGERFVVCDYESPAGCAPHPP